MRSAPFTLALITALACGGRAGVDEGVADTEADGGTFNGGATPGGASNGGATSGGARSSGGHFASCGAPATSGGRFASGGRSTNGGAPALGGSVSSGGSLTAGGGGEAGAAGGPGCFFATQGGDNYCIFVIICAAEQREVLCTIDPATALTTCTCFSDGRPTFSLMDPLPYNTNLCQLANSFGCR